MLNRKTHQQIICSIPLITMLRFLSRLAAFGIIGKLTCRSIPGDATWPSAEDWSRLNTTVNGRLSATVPLGHVCHDPTYNETQCAELIDRIIKNGADVLCVTQLSFVPTRQLTVA